MLVEEVDGRNSAAIASLVPCPSPAALAPLWRELEARADASFFQSWGWIGTVIATFGAPAWLAMVQRDGRVIGLGLLGWRPGRIFDWLRTPSLHLNETGDAARDAVMIEYNGLLAEAGREAAANAAMVTLLAGKRDGSLWRELYLSGVAPAIEQECQRAGLMVRRLKTHVAPLADFSAMAPGDPLDALSRNSRQQIRRALRYYENRGAVAVEPAASIDQAQAGLEALAQAHTAAWQARGRPGAFANPNFHRFHRHLIADGFAAGTVELLTIRAGDAAIGYLYNFRYGRFAYSYQSGFHYEADERAKPGLVGHVLAMRAYRAQGLAGYRFLAGDSRYKASLSTGHDELRWLAVHRPDLPHRLEALARTVLRTVRSYRPPGNDATN